MMDLPSVILDHLEQKDSIDSVQLSQLLQQDHQKVIGAIKSLQAVACNVIDVEQQTCQSWELTEEGSAVADRGSHEALIFNAVPEKEGITHAELMKSVPAAKIGFSKAMSAGWIHVEKGEKTMVKRKVAKIDDAVQMLLQKIKSNFGHDVSDGHKQELKKRKLLQEVTIKKYIVSKGIAFKKSLVKLETDLTSTMLTKQAWKGVQFKPYNFNALGAVLPCGHLHPLMKVREEFRRIFLEMGFTEMKTNNFIESSFWNFDALFQPQQHPARDAHDTFFISDPQFASSFPDNYLQNVKAVHEKGGYGSQGYNYKWKIEEAQKNLLRTHTTAVSARMLYQLAQQEEIQPIKYFSIDRVFRNETLDATHLAEFHQIEGVIVDYNLTLGHLIGVLYEFFKKLGITQLKFKPAYNPYTEPSMEIFSYHEGLGKWVEVGNSGVFRPELLLPMGLPSNIQVVAWGLSLERPTMIKYGINNIRDLVGHKVDLQMVHENPLCRLDKNTCKPRNNLLKENAVDLVRKQQTRILLKLHNIWNDVRNIHESLKHHEEVLPQSKLSNEKPLNLPGLTNGIGLTKCNDNHVMIANDAILIYCNPRYPLWSLVSLMNQLCDYMPVEITITADANIKDMNRKLLNFINVPRVSSLDGPPLLIQLHWKESGGCPMMITSGKCILGEVNIIRYFGRLLQLHDDDDPVAATIVDVWLDRIQKCVICANGKDKDLFLKELDNHLSVNMWLGGNWYCVADLGLWSALQRSESIRSCAPSNVARWLHDCSSISWNASTANWISHYYHD